MRNFIHAKVMTITLVGIIMGAWVASAHASREASSADTANTNSFRSAFLGPDVWEDHLSALEVKQQLQEHFAQVIERLESTNTTSLKRALTRAEANAIQPWTQSQRRAALISLATNRQRQIARLRYYMNRGLFPQNEGQSTSAVPIFVDQHQTHCAVGFLMHSDGNDSGVASIVRANNLVRVNDVRRGSMIDWIRSSGLTQEEAALIQPGYPVPEVTNFNQLSAPGATLQGNGFVVSEATFRSHRFETTLPLPINAQNDPAALQSLFEIGKILIAANEFEASIVAGISFGSQIGSSIRHPGNLEESLYIGSAFTGLGTFPFTASGSFFGNDPAFVEVDYMIRSEQSDFSQIALTSNGRDINSGTVLLVSQIFDGDTDELLGETQLSEFGMEFLLESRTDSIQVETDFVRIKSYALVVGEVELTSFFHEFGTIAGDPGGGGEPSGELGDVNLDGAVDFLDIQPLIDLLSFGRFQAEGDMDLDGDVDFLDIPLFIARLANPN